MTVQVYDAVVLAGGAARRLGGADKPGLRVGGRPLLDRVLGACRGAAGTVVVGSRRPTVRPVRWAYEDPPGGGPLAALDAGLRQVTAPVVLALSADLPFLSAGTVHALLAALEDPSGTPAAYRPEPDVRTGRTASAEPTGPVRPAISPVPDGPAAAAGRDGRRARGAHARSTGSGARTARISAEGAAGSGQFGRGAGSEPGPTRPEGVLLTDADGRDQPLVAVYRTEPLRRELALIATEHGGLAHLPLRLLTADLVLRRLPVPDTAASFDCDTWEDLAAARARIRDHGHVLDEWMTAVKDELGIELDVDTAALLDLARDAAHGVARPAAPLTTFLAGYAAAQAGGGPEAVAEAARKAAALAARWADESADGRGKTTE